MRGHLLPHVVMMPFSVLKASEGKPCRFQSLTCVGLAMNSQKLNSGEYGISNFCICNSYKIFSIQGIRLKIIYKDEVREQPWSRLECWISKHKVMSSKPRKGHW